MTVEDAFAERIRLLSPTKQEITSFLQSHVPQINPGVASFLSLLRKRGTEYYLVSGGFLEVVMERTRDVVDRATLSRPADSLRPRGLQSLSLRFRRFLSGIRHNAMDVQEPWEVAGDPIVIAENILSSSILESHGWVHSVMIGDGVTDLETRDVVDAFVGYAGVKDREVVQNAADLSVTSFETLLPFLL